ncbi:MAG: hypothetical protein AAFS10_18110 [Myxococcota bacterium]
MNETMIQRWNAQVGHDDTVYHLGDFTLGDTDMARAMFLRLHGHIKVLGNHWHHDAKWLPEGFGLSDFTSASGQPVEILPPMVVLEFPEWGDGRYPKALILCHYPLAQWDRRHHGSWHLHGHSHGTHLNGGRSFDVGVDCTDFRPLNLAEVHERMAQLDP